VTAAGGGGRHLLAINFRDMAHPEAGGAELHLEQILLAAVRRGWRVTWLASGFRGGAGEAEHRGIRVVRRGTWWNFNLIVPGVLRREFSGPPPDLIVEDINKAPCLTPWCTRAPVAVIVPHLFGATILRETAPPIALYVLALEALIPFVYRRCRFVAISESTRDDLIHRGVDAARITVVHCGLDHDAYRPDPAVGKTPHPTIVFVGRLRRYKGVDWVMRSLPAVVTRAPGTRLLVIGDGPFEPALRRAARRLGVADAVEFLGFLPGAEKVRHLQRAWVVVQPSPKEGWGLTVVEAGACGAAVVAADRPGLRDSVRRDETGLLVPWGDDGALAGALARVLLDRPLREGLAARGVEWAGRFSWPACGDASMDALVGSSERPARSSGDPAGSSAGSRGEPSVRR
jgi:glycosyltransferase involved in cell wall biosynthesis